MAELEPDYPDFHHDGGVVSRQESVMPRSIEAEQSVLGGLMLDASGFDAVCEVISEEDLYKAAHRQIFHVMLHLVEHEQPIDVITVSEELNRRDELESAGGLSYLTDLAANVSGSANLPAYARIVRERSTLRQLISAAGKSVKRVTTPAS